MDIRTDYLVVGNSIAGVSCAEGIRSVDGAGSITIISEERHKNYSRPLISYYLGGKVERSSMSFRDEGFYNSRNIDTLLETRLEKIATAEKVAYTSRSVISFGKMLISTGGVPLIPPIEGLQDARRGVFSFMCMDDADKIISHIESRGLREAVVLGGGLIGLKCAEGLLERGISVVIVELSDRLLSNTLDKDASVFLEEALMGRDCRVITGDTIVRIESTRGAVERVFLKHGGSLETDTLVIAAGVRPNIQFLQGEGTINVDRGIKVNSRMETSARGIYAAGDVVESRDIISGADSVLAIWPAAARQGKVAGINMAGGDKKYNGFFPMNSVEIAGVPTISFGVNESSGFKGSEVLKKTAPGIYKKIILCDNRIIGAIFLGQVERSGIFAGLIRDRVDVSDFKDVLLEDGFGLIELPREYRKHIVTGEGMEV